MTHPELDAYFTIVTTYKVISGLDSAPLFLYRQKPLVGGLGYSAVKWRNVIYSSIERNDHLRRRVSDRVWSTYHPWPFIRIVINARIRRNARVYDQHAAGCFKHAHRRVSKLGCFILSWSYMIMRLSAYCKAANIIYYVRTRDVKRDQMLEPRPDTWGRGRGRGKV